MNDSEYVGVVCLTTVALGVFLKAVELRRTATIFSCFGGLGALFSVFVLRAEGVGVLMWLITAFIHSFIVVVSYPAQGYWDIAWRVNRVKFQIRKMIQG
jgi:hypothetical protein